MSALAPIVHALLVGADALDSVVDELPDTVCKDQRLLLSALARAASITADRLQKEERERENRFYGPSAPRAPMANLFDDRKITYSDQEDCARRELAFRRRLYPRWVQQKKLSQAEADREIEVMSSIVDVFAKCRELEESGRDRLRR
jgi:predicted XRE-type DNA-binding protein